MRPNTQFVIGGSSATNASQLTAAIDTRGFNFARIVCLAAVTNTNGLSTTNAHNILEESDDLTTYVTIAAAGAGTAYTPTSASAATTLAKLVYEIDLRGRRRYLKPTFTQGATGHHFIVAELGMASDGLIGAAENGAAFVAQV